MEPLKAIIVEDNPFMATLLQDMLSSFEHEITIVATAKTGKEALELISSVEPEVIFLDIELPDMDGFELLQQIETIQFQTVFTTSHSHYAIKAFRFNALDYLVKPINRSELNETINRLQTFANNSVAVKNALTNLASESVEDQKLVLPQQNGTLSLALNQITHIEGERNYSTIHLAGRNKELSSKNLAYFEDILFEKHFFRCHRSFLINYYHIQALFKDHFVLKNDLKIPISRRKMSEAKTWFYVTG